MKTEESVASETKTTRPLPKGASERSFTITFVVDQTPEQVFAAVNDVRGWWSQTIQGTSDHVGAEFEFHSKGLHLTTHRIVELVPGRRVVWRTIASDLHFVADRREWEGTEVVFDIQKKGSQTELRFTHVGLVPEVECYATCVRGWTFYAGESLRALITTGRGEPDGRDQRVRS